MSNQSAPARCTTCNGTGQGPTVIDDRGTYRAPCGPCNGTGQQ
jgi:hypothetical protein